MNISARVSTFRTAGKVKAIASVSLDDSFVIKRIRIVEGVNGLFISMPAVKNASGEFKDICFPCTKGFRSDLENAVIEAYREGIAALVESECE